MVAPYRNDHDALMARLVGLIDELASIRSRASALRDLERTEQDVEREIANVRRTVARVAPTRLPLLERVSIAAPCSAEWSSMTGDERTRFCAQCQKHVHNIASMSAEEAETFLRGAGGEACLRIYRRTDGTVLTSDCSVGVRRRRRRRVVASLVGGSLVTAGALLAFESSPPPAPMVGQTVLVPTPTEATAEPSVEPTTPPPATAAPTVRPSLHTAGRPATITPQMQLDAELSHVRSLLDQRAGITDPVKRRGVEAEIRAASQRVIQLSPPRVDPKAP
jgi:hypothetical protein